MTAATAWIVPLPGGVRVALGTLEFVHVLTDAPARTVLADAPAYLSEAISWNGAMVPVFDAGKFSEGIEKLADTVYYGIVRFRPAPAVPQRFGALKMSAIPQRITVDDKWACALPDIYEHWRRFSLSCFELDGRPVPVLDLARLFAQAPTGAAAAGKADGAPTGPNEQGPSGYTDPLAAT